MSDLAAPHITLEQARQLVTFLENGEQHKANSINFKDCLSRAINLFAEVGKLTRQLHKSLKGF